MFGMKFVRCACECRWPWVRMRMLPEWHYLFYGYTIHINIHGPNSNISSMETANKKWNDILKMHINFGGLQRHLFSSVMGVCGMHSTSCTAKYVRAKRCERKYIHIQSNSFSAVGLYLDRAMEVVCNGNGEKATENAVDKVLRSFSKNCSRFRLWFNRFTELDYQIYSTCKSIN